MNEGILKVMADLKIDTSITREVSPMDGLKTCNSYEILLIYFRL